MRRPHCLVVARPTAVARDVRVQKIKERGEARAPWASTEHLDRPTDSHHVRARPHQARACTKDEIACTRTPTARVAGDMPARLPWLPSDLADARAEPPMTHAASACALVSHPLTPGPWHACALESSGLRNSRPVIALCVCGSSQSDKSHADATTHDGSTSSRATGCLRALWAGVNTVPPKHRRRVRWGPCAPGVALGRRAERAGRSRGDVGRDHVRGHVQRCGRSHSGAWFGLRAREALVWGTRGARVERARGALPTAISSPYQADMAVHIRLIWNVISVSCVYQGISA
jgi:hypothetical protein